MFRVHDRGGVEIVRERCVLDAIDAMHHFEAAESVVNDEDGAVIATKFRFPRAHIYAWAWALSREPEREP